MAKNEIYLDSNNHWRFVDSNRMAPNPNSKRCKELDCSLIVRNKNSEYCKEHTDWTKTAHGSSILNNADIIFLFENYLTLSDKEMANVLKLEPHHKGNTVKSIWRALQHHRRKYINNRYDKKFYYKTIKSKYKELHPICEICSWSEGSIDVHHIWQVSDFDDEVHYHKIENLISLCPNHHRFVEEMRENDKSKYTSYIGKYKK